jgi:hypothetical protein
MQRAAAAQQDIVIAMTDASATHAHRTLVQLV